MMTDLKEKPSKKWCVWGCVWVGGWKGWGRLPLCVASEELKNKEKTEKGNDLIVTTRNLGFQPRFTENGEKCSFS